MTDTALAIVPPFATTIRELLLASTARHPDDVAIVFNRETLTRRMLTNRALDFASALQVRGIGPGDHVLTLLGNSSEHVALLLGASLIGAVLAPLHPESRGPTLAHMLSVVDPQLIVTDGSRFDLAQIDTPGARVAIDDLGAGLHAQPSSLYAASPDDLRAIMFTSGTSGAPKGVMVSERMLVASAAGTALASMCADEDVFLMWEPLHHIGGAQLLVLALSYRIRLILIERFSASAFWSQVRTHRVTRLHYLGGILEILLKAKPGANDRRHSIEVAFGGGCRREVWRRFEERFGIPVREVYGMTEASSFTTVNTSGTIGSVGKPVPWFEVEIENDEGGSVSDGETGQLVVRGKYPGLLTPGYLANASATEKLRKDDRLYTGDLACRIDGEFYFVGRLSDSVRVRGQNVSAWEVETVLSAHESIVECAVVGVDAQIGEQEILCYLRLHADSRIEPADIARWCQSRLQRHHIPRYWKVVDDFARTPSQRIRKDQLRRSAADAFDSANIDKRRSIDTADDR